MIRISSLLFFFIVACSTMMAGGPLKNPLAFIPSDSIVVWGDDRSDFRTTALSVAPELTSRPIVLSAADTKKFKKTAAWWKKDLLPSLNILGGIGKEGDLEQVLPTAEMMKEAGKLFLQTADASYLDVVERTSLNGLMAILSPGALSFEKHIAAQALMNVSGMIYATDEVGIYVNFYINSSTHIKTDKLNFVIDQLTAMPHSNRVKLRIGGIKKGQQPIVVRLRMPSWSYGNLSEHLGFTLQGVPEKVPVVYVNGREEFYKMENGYLVINRLWNSGDEIYFDFPFEVLQLRQVNKGKTDFAKVALQRGPLVYGATQPIEETVQLGQVEFVEKAEANDFGHSLVVAKDKRAELQNQQWETQPVMDGVKQLWLNVKN